MAALIDNFKAVEFRTICPLVMPEKHFSAPLDEAERIFQHYLSAMLVEVSEQAVRHGQADGQWFFFHLDPQRPAAGDLTPDLLRIKSSRSWEAIEPILPGRTGSVLAGLVELASRFPPMQEAMDKAAEELKEKIMQMEANLARHSNALEEARSYTAHVESELARKNEALASLERRVQELEAEVVRARTPRLRWK
jgi:hypothetical protein